MQELKKEYDNKLIALFSQQLNSLEQLHGYKVKRLVLERDEDWDCFFTIDSEVINKQK